MAEKLLPCPFCGCEDIQRDDNGYEEWLKCSRCSAAGPYTAEDAEEGVSLDDAWNRRAGDILAYYARQIEWSRHTFGPALRTKGVIDHIRKELVEIEREPHDLTEWVDVVILAMDGFWRHGGNAEDLMPALLVKQQKNMARVWPDWRTMSEDSAIEHDRSQDAPGTIGGAE